MNTIATKQNKIRENLKMALFICAASLLITSTIFYVAPLALAEGDDALSGVLGMLKTVLAVICSVVGVIFAVIGVVKIAIAHANEDGPAQSKAAMMIGTGIVLTILGAAVIPSLPLDTWLAGVGQSAE